MHRYLPALFLTYGHEVAYVPVNDRPRQAGQSKYNNIGRALIGLYDLVGVSWLRRRTAVPDIVEDVPEGRHISDLGRRLKLRAERPVRNTGDKG
jgi:dolichol-phosphate mannosyltransferase